MADSDWMGGWQELGDPPSRRLWGARLELHHAVQIVSAVGKTHLALRPDDSHPNMGWVHEGSMLAGHPVEEDGFQAALRVPELTLLLRRAGGEVIDELSLEGRKVSEAFDWLARAIASHTSLNLRPLQPTGYDIPDHPVARGAPFSSGLEKERAELARWFANADLALGNIASHYEGVDVRCWPRHFDIAILIVLDRHLPAEQAPSIGAGMTPGDDSYREPYWYCNPYPRPEFEDASQLPSLEGGAHWHTAGWFGAVLTSRELTATEGARRQARQTQAYLDSALPAARRLIGRD